MADSRRFCIARRPRRKRSVKKQPVYKGITFASKEEVVLAKWMDRRKIKWQYESDKFKWSPPAQNYTPDFKVKRKDGTEFFVEYKGFLRSGRLGDDKIKMRMIKEQYPDLDVRFVFSNVGKPLAGSKPRKDGTRMSHAEWAEKYNYKWSEKTIPKEWLEE